MTRHRIIEFQDEPHEAIESLEAIGEGRGWCNLTPEVRPDDVVVLAPSVFSLRTRRGAPVATYVTEPPRRGTVPPATVGVLHTRGRLGTEQIHKLLDGVPLRVRQDHQARGLLLEVPPEVPAATVLATMRRLLEELCDYDRTGKWRLEVYERGRA